MEKHIQLAFELGLDPEKVRKWLEFSGIAGELEKLKAARNSGKERSRRLREASKTKTKVPLPHTPTPQNSLLSDMAVEESRGTNAIYDPDDTSTHLHSYVHRSANPPRWFFETYNKICTKLPKAQAMTKRREVAARLRLQDYTTDEIESAFVRANASPFCRGENDRKWVATVDFFLRPDSIQYTLEGKYDDRTKGPATVNRPRGAAYQSHAGPSLGALRAEAQAAARGAGEGAGVPDGLGAGPVPGGEDPDEGNA